MSGPPRLELRNICKTYGAVRALADVSVAVERGTVHALVGENGAGKSTLGKVMSGRVSAELGTILVNGSEVHFSSPRDALFYGITGIAQELALLPARTVLDNVFLGEASGRCGMVNKRLLLSRYDELQRLVGLDVNPARKVHSLRIADQQKVEILRAVARSADVIVLDEPTSSLPLDDARSLLGLVRRLADGGASIVLVSHNLREILAVSDTVTVLKDGCHVRTTPAGRHTEESLVESMLGRSLERAFPTKRPPAPTGARPVLQVRDLSGTSGLHSASFEVYPGEIVGVAGLVGSGRTELLRTIFGADRRTHGSVRLEGARVRGGPRAALKRGLAMLPENRRDEGLVLRRSVGENIVLSHLSKLSSGGVLRRRAVHASAGESVRRLEVKTPDLRTPVGRLSGGNQQKVLFGRCLLGSPTVLLADEPTRGVDIGAKLAIYTLLVEAARSGVGVVFASSEMDEILGLAHRVLVMRDKQVVKELPMGAISEAEIMRAAFGSGDPSAHDILEVKP